MHEPFERAKMFQPNFASVEWRVVSLALLLSLPHTAQADPLDKEISNLLQQRFSIAVLLSDTDAIAFGIGDFDPNALFDTANPEFGTDESINERRSKSVYVLPYTTNFNIEGSEDLHELSFKAFTIQTENDLKLFGTSKDLLKERTYGASIGYGYLYKASENVTLSTRTTTHLMRYENSFSTDNKLSSIIGRILDGRAVNVSAWAAIVQPSIKAKYTSPTSWGKWHASSTLNSFIGHSWGSANNGNIGNPKGWYLSNEITGYYNIYHGEQALFTGIKRVDLSHDLSDELGSPHYYEASIGWLFYAPKPFDWLDNFGIGVNFNYGSTLRGGSIQLYYNKQ
ncbi:Solitary outer membrane autotransporter beta-barrel domain [Vibrio alginolyticus]|uniref:Solitary outer membrane autotransporter beta-barrel domain n=3 Tax=Vibrio TaxID=662 RepID=UPI002022C243|nr:Solitary outer membrane autotransporter beta-barrel domain [Vibrio alginolyticus]